MLVKFLKIKIERDSKKMAMQGCGTYILNQKFDLIRILVFSAEKNKKLFCIIIIMRKSYQQIG